MKDDSFYNLLDQKYREFIESHQEHIRGKFPSKSLKISPGCEVLYLGCSSCEGVANLINRGARVLSICKDELKVVKARKEGFATLLMNAEYIPYLNRFHRVICEDYLYMIECPSIAFEKIIDSLQVGGVATIEMIVNSDESIIREFILQVLKENGYIYSLYTPRWPSESVVKKSIPKYRLKSYKISAKYKTELIKEKNVINWFMPYIKMASAHLTKDKQRHFFQLMEIIIQKNIEKSPTRSIIAERKVLKIEMVKLR